MAFCANCGTKIEEGIKFCSGCGKAVIGVSNEPVTPMVQQPVVLQAQTVMADEMYCFSCGSAIKKIAEICPKCGVKQISVPYSQNVPTEKKNNVVFLIFSILFIVVGIPMSIAGFFEIMNSGYLYPLYPYLLLFFVLGTGFILIGILFSIISLYRKPNKMYFWFCISPCILLTVWNAFALIMFIL